MAGEDGLARARQLADEIASFIERHRREGTKITRQEFTSVMNELCRKYRVARCGELMIAVLAIINNMELLNIWDEEKGDEEEEKRRI